MSSSKQFDCPSCAAPITFKGGESLFQTCESCMAPVIVPSEFLYEKGAQLASENFASLNNDLDVDIEQVTNELTPGDSLPDSTIAGWEDAKIERFDVYQEKIGSGSKAEKADFDSVTSSPGVDSGIGASLTGSTPYEQLSATLDLIRSELNAGDKVAAIKIFREAFNSDVSAAKDAVEAIERGEEIDLSVFLEG